MDEDLIEGKLPRPDERNSNETVEMTVANIVWGYGGLVTGHEKAPELCFIVEPLTLIST